MPPKQEPREKEPREVAAFAVPPPPLVPAEAEEGREAKDFAEEPSKERERPPERPSSPGKRNGNGNGNGSAKGQVAEHAATAPLESLSLRDDPIPSVPPPPAAGPWRSYKEILAKLSQRVLEAQRPIRILQALRWESAVEEQFLRGKQRDLPKVTYASDLGFDADAKIAELEEILRDAERELGKNDRLGQILRQTAAEYRDVVRMLKSRGKRDFYKLSRVLYGSPKDKLPDGQTSVRDMGIVLYDVLTAIGGEKLGPPERREITAEMAAMELNARFDRFFGSAAIRVQVDDSILADAAAGSDYVKIRSGATFSTRDIDILEAHEGWVHVATNLNGQAQPVARWLGKGPPRTTAVQEGLAALVEIFTFRSSPRRAKKLNDRILAVDKAEDGASFLDVFEWYRTEGYEEDECFQNARRVFRGGLLEGGGPFTKDACYCKGIVLNYAFMRAAIQQDKAALIPFLFVGKVAHEDVPVLYAHVTDGIVKPPPYLPPLFDDMNGLAIWMCYSSFFSRLGATAIAEHYSKVMAL
ncbi:flavohemoglobin expression-modulating QEGLA motif protein [Polyangium sp. y55x31]|uniref:flavohemoglobin expression-modulating QEGLA motif protein n=1 Tax=Polyangium sp. y55x31 TaxID=3042688 RepID=UPI00248244CA|nr:flavohemoglobin expression-modulating QEGLA motif protein [Polyangium sp. y55x31]MDI1482983.1 flavohemoglobin expression-modulating QEGLA motif protein [Polyangium sp. y55x31]